MNQVHTFLSGSGREPRLEVINILGSVHQDTVLAVVAVVSDQVCPQREQPFERIPADAVGQYSLGDHGRRLREATIQARMRFVGRWWGWSGCCARINYF